MTDQLPPSLGASRFARSVNLEQDLTRPESLSGYLITSGVRRALQRIAVPPKDGPLNRAITLTGPYGTGKSAFALFCSHLLAPTSWPNHKTARQLLHAADATLETAVFNHRRQSPSLLPVVVTGAREPLAFAVVRALASSFETVKGARAKKHLAALKKVIRRSTRGHVPESRVVCDLLADSLAASGRGQPAFEGLLLVLDELGKMLEYATGHPTESDVYVLQAVAEFAVRCDHPLLMLGVLHQDFAAYSDRLGSRDRAEWEKVRGRFEDVAFEEPADEILRLVAEARTHANKSPPKSAARQKRAFEELLRSAHKLDLAPAGISDAEFGSLLERCRPLHPLVALILGPLFRKAAQNERSVFSFLESGEPNGLREFLSDSARASSDLYRTDRLYDYFVSSVGPGLYGHTFGKRWAEIDSVLARLANPTQLDVFLVKTIGLLSVVGQSRQLRASRDVLCFAAGGLATPNEIEARLKLLRSQSAIVHRRYNASFALWEGSDLDIDDLVKASASRLADTTSIASLASKYLPTRPLVARRHSFDTGTLRFFSVRFASPGSLDDVGNEHLAEADGAVIVVLPVDADGLRTVLQSAVSEAWEKRDRLLLAIATDPSVLVGAVREFAVLSWVQDNAPELGGDMVARRELRVRIAAARQRMENAISEIISPSAPRTAQCRWFYRAKECHPASQRQLNEELSHICDRVFPNTPRIKNELINRRALSSAAAAARRNLIDAMISRGAAVDLGIRGTPPEKSMYLTILTASGIHRRGGPQRDFRFGPPKNGADRGLQAVWEAMSAFFAGSDAASRNVGDLFASLQQPPFGMKEGPIPVLLCAALLAGDADIALYEEGSFVPQLTVAVFERLMKAPSRFAVQRWKITGVRMAIFERLAQIFVPTSDPATKSKNQILAVVRPLCAFAGSLNAYTRTAASLSPSARGIRDVLLRATKPDQLLFTDLPVACGLPPFDGARRKDTTLVDQFIVTLKSGVDELRTSYERLLHEIENVLKQAFDLIGDVSNIRPTLAARGGVIEPWIADARLKNFVARLIATDLTDEPWLESIAALLTLRPPAVWKDEDRAKFEITVATVARLFRHVEALAFENEGVTGDDDVVRVGITTRHAPEVERVIRIPQGDRELYEKMQRSIRDALCGVSLNGHSDTAAAALIGVAQELLKR